MGFYFLLNIGGETIPVDRKRAARRDPVDIGTLHDQRAHIPHFPMKESNSVIFRIIRAEGVGADKFRETIGQMRIGPANGAHFMEDDGYTRRNELPGGFASGKTAADNMYGFLICTHGYYAAFVFLVFFALPSAGLTAGRLARMSFRYRPV